MEDKTLRDKIQEELEKLSKLSWGQRIGYIWDYYKPLLAGIVGVFALIGLGVTIYQNLQLERVLDVYLINCNALMVDADEMSSDFVKYVGSLEKNQVVTVDTSLDIDEEDNSQYGMANQMKLTTLTASGEIDLMLMDQDMYERYLEAEFFEDLKEVLTAEQQEKWSSLFVGAGETYTQGEPVFALDLTDAPVIRKYDAYHGDRVYGCVVKNKQYSELCDDFFAYLLEGE